MFKVLIADDEPSVITSLKDSIQWDSLGLKLEACASGGREVIEIVEEQQIDIAILDIRMPGMNGLELCDYLRKNQKDIQLIIISGYAEFSYAERAIRYGVLGYCLKPLEYDQITKLLLKAVKNLEKAAPAISGADFLDALEGEDSNAVAEILNRVGFEEKAYYVAVTIGEGKLGFPPNEGMIVEFGRGQCGYITRRPLLEEEIRTYLKNPENQGIGGCKEPVGPGEIAAALHSCTVKAYQFFVDPQCRICWEVQELKANELLSGILYNVEKNRWDAVCDQLTVIDEKYRKEFTIRSSTKLCNMIYTGSLFREEETDYYIYSLKQLVSEYGSLTEMLRRLREAIISAKTSGVAEESFTNTAFMKLMGYINKNYKNEISLTSAGEALHMNPNYVSQLFKKEAGTTFIRYITQLRLDDAVKLLMTTNMPVVDIAMGVGFNDYFYFLKTFKKFKGKTPSQYRKEN